MVEAGRNVRKKRLSIISVPLIAIFSILLILPLIVVLILTFHFLYAIFLIFAVITGVFLIFWSILKSKAKDFDINAGRRIAVTAVSILAFSFIVHAAANISVSRSLKRTMTKAEAEGILLAPEEVIPPPVPDEDNAALVYEEAFDLFEKLKNKYHEEWEYMPYATIRTAELTEAQKADIIRIMAEPEFNRFYGLIEKAVNMPVCRFDMGLENYPQIVTSHFSAMRSMARMLAARIYILSEEGRFDEAVESTKTFLRLAGALEDEPLVISYLVRIAIDAIAVCSLETLLNSPEIAISVEEYREFISIFEEKNISVTPGLLGDFTLDSSWITGHETNYSWLRPYSDGFWWRINPDILDIILSKPLVYLYEGYLGSPIFKHDYNFYLRSSMAIIADSKLPYFKAKDSAERWERKIDDLGIFFKRILTHLFAVNRPVLQIVMQAEHQALFETCRLGLAAEIYRLEYGAYPESLEELVPDILPELSLDPFTGEDYIYRREDEGFVVYSVGRNETDDGGLHSPPDGDIVWRIERD